MRFTVDWLASELNGLAEIAWIAVTPPRSGCGGATAATPGGVARSALRAAAVAFGVAPFTETQIGVSL